MLGIRHDTVLRKARIAVFADCENIVNRTSLSSRARSLGWVDDGSFFAWNPVINRLLSQWGRLTRIYGYTSAHGDAMARKSLFERMKAAGITAPQVYPKKKGSARKQVDIALATEATRQAHLDTFDVAVFVTGDRDFVPVFRCLKDMGKGVVLLAPPSGLSPDLANESDETYSLVSLLDEDFREVELLSARRPLQDQHFVTTRSSVDRDSQCEIPLLMRRSTDAPPGRRSVVLAARASEQVKRVVLAGSGVHETLTERVSAGADEINCGAQIFDLLPEVELSSFRIYVQLFAEANVEWVEIAVHSDAHADRFRFLVEPGAPTD